MGERVINLPHHRPRHLSSDDQCAAMDVHKVAAVALLLLFAGSVRCEPPTYNLLEWCGQTLYLSSSMLLNVDVSARRYLTQSCQVSIFSQHGASNNFVRLQLLKVDADCKSLSMRLYDGSGTWSPLTEAICGHVSTSSRMFVTTLNVMTINIDASGYFERNMKFSMLATSFSLDDSYGDFQCDNYDFIASELKCDGYNNCGDRSDEDFCQMFFWPWKIAAIAGGCTAAAVIIVVVIIAVRRRSRRAQQNKNTNQAVTPIKQAGAPVLPSYGTIPGSGYQPYTTSPPPYSIVDIQVSTPPPSPATPPPPPATPPRAEPATPAVEDAAAGMKIN